MKKFVFVFLFLPFFVFAQSGTNTLSFYTLSGKTSLGTKTRPGIVALSPDLLEKHPLGSCVKVVVPGKDEKVLRVEDRTAKERTDRTTGRKISIQKRIDVWTPRGTVPSEGVFRNVHIETAACPSDSERGGEGESSHDASGGDGVFFQASKGSLDFHSCPFADINGDGRIDIVDLVLVGRVFGESNLLDSDINRADVNRDAVVDILDLVLIAQRFGERC